MRRFLPLSLVVLLVGCSEPPKPEKAQDLDKIQPKDDPAAGSELGPIPDGPIALVNGVEISNASFRETYDLKVKKYTDRGREIPSSADRRYRKSIAERLIYQVVLEQEAKAKGVTYDPAALAERDEQQKRGIKDWDKHLERRGETEASLREMAVSELLEKALLDKSGKLQVTQQEIDAEYEKIKGNYKSDKERIRASHILIPIGPERAEPGDQVKEPSPEEQKKWDAEALAKAQDVYKQVTSAGTDFEAVAKQYSTGPNASKGGDLGIFTPDRMVKEFSDVAFKLKPGQISKPVRTKFGFHIIKVTGKWSAGELPKDALVDQIKERLEQRKLHQGRRELKEELLAKYKIEDRIAATLGPEPAGKKAQDGAISEAADKKNEEAKQEPG